MGTGNNFRTVRRFVCRKSDSSGRGFISGSYFQFRLQPHCAVGSSKPVGKGVRFDSGVSLDRFEVCIFVHRFKTPPEGGVAERAPLLLWRLGNARAIALACRPQFGVGSDLQPRPLAAIAPSGNLKSIRKTKTFPNTSKYKYVFRSGGCQKSSRGDLRYASFLYLCIPKNWD